MNRCVVCGKEFQPSKNFEEKKTCSKECYSEYMRSIMPDNFKKTQFKSGQEAWNKGKSQNEWMSEKAIEKVSKTHIQYQYTELGKLESRHLPHNTKHKGAVTRRVTIHKEGKNAGKEEVVYYINIDWHGNRKPNNLYKRYIWELYNQQDLPKGYIIYSVDGNPDNLDINNLEAITRRELLRRNGGR